MDHIAGLFGLGNYKGFCLSEDITPKQLCMEKKEKKREREIEITL